MDVLPGFDCERCKHDPNLAESQGCNGPCSHPIETLTPCFLCAGRGCSVCAATGGTEGEFHIYECPRKRLEECPELVQRLNYYNQIFKPSGTLPVGGGMFDQTMWFQEFIGFMNRVIPLIEHEKALIKKAQKR